ncbi:MAG TPA: enoyl-CoA hydratase-related protein, partial [Steroidobacteraceae bacterium]
MLTLNRPERRNALGTEGMPALDAALRGAERDAAMRAVVLRGAPPAFCAGGAFCQLDSGYCELVKRLRDPSLSSPLFKRIAEIAVSEPNLLATRLAEAGVEPRLAL